MSTILIGVDDIGAIRDAIAFGRRLADAAGADVIVACAYPYSDLPSRASNAAYREALRDDALETVEAMREELGDVGRARRRSWSPPTSPRRTRCTTWPRPSDAALIVVGSTHTGRAGRVLPGSTGERLLHGSPCAVAVVPTGLPHARRRADPRASAWPTTPPRRPRPPSPPPIELARALGAELEIIGVVSAESYGTPALMSGGPSAMTLREDIERHVQESLDAMVAEVAVRRRRVERAPDRRPGRRARRAQRRARPAGHRLARLRPAALRARRRRQRPPDALRRSAR